MKNGGDPAFLPAGCLFMSHCYIVLSDVLVFFFFASFRFYICLLPSIILVEDIDQNIHICFNCMRKNLRNV
jgi:hypothetical protein